VTNFFRTISIITCIFISNIAFSQTADFSITTNNNLFCNPQTVTFTQTCTGNPDGFLWDFGNNNVGSNPTEIITYILPGTYTVTLTALFGNNAVTTTKTVVINPNPTVGITADRSYICQPGNITFTAATPPSVTSYEWNFGDGSPNQTTTTNTTTHNFASYNSFTVTVRAITATGCFASTSMSVQVTRFSINASVTPNDGCIPVNSTLSASANLPTGDVANNFVWNFGDATTNATTTIGNTPHTYNITTDITTASVAITTAQGCTNNYTFPRFAFGIPPTNLNAYTVALRDTFCGSESIQFYGKATSANLYRWDFGDGVVESRPDTLVSHKYATLGAKTVTVTPIFNGCLGVSQTLNIYVTGVIATYTFANTCIAKRTFNFTNTSTGPISTYQWTYNDGSGIIDATPNATHTFPPSGGYTTQLLIIDNITGCRDSLSSSQFTAIPNITSNKGRVCRDSVIKYVVSNTYSPNSGFIYEFNVGGIKYGSGYDSVFNNFQPPNFGSYNDYVVIVGDNVCNDTIRLVNPTLVTGPFVNFTIPADLCRIVPVQLNNLTYPFFGNTNPNDSIVKWKWEFGDNTKDSVRNPLPHTYASAGTFKIKLTAIDSSNCVQMDSMVINIRPMPNIRALPVLDTLCLGDSTQLRVYTTDTLLWTPATYITCPTCDSTYATPPITTQYIAQAKNQYGCISYDTTLIKVYTPINLQIFPVDTIVCPQQLVQYRTADTGIFTWSPGTFLNRTDLPNPFAIPDSAITYQVILKDSVGCFADTTDVIIRTFPKPTVNAGADTIVTFNTPFVLNPIYSGNMSEYLWSPLTNNLSCDDCPSPTGIALQSEEYKIIATSNDGCIAVDSIKVFLTCAQSNLFVPTIFTPNNDGKNDLFTPITRGYKVINRFTIYNRWGKKVFEKTNVAPNSPELSWNGRNSGVALKNETFVWFLEATCDLGEKLNTKGTVVLVR
jgi:gliding motility-associated-like protein